jgi:radical SAM superfamily enzyme YgiQ (UPF0313 family)
VFGMDDDDRDVFDRTVDWAVSHGVTTATFHIQTPYPGTRLHEKLAREGRIITDDWDRYDTRHVVYRPAKLTAEALERGYFGAYRDFYRWRNIARGAASHDSLKHQAKHFFYAAGWKKFEPLWDLVIKTRRLDMLTPLLEAVLAKVTRSGARAQEETAPAQESAPRA